MIIDTIEINNLQEIEVKKVTVKGQSFVRLKLNIRKQYISVPTNIYFDFNIRAMDNLINTLRMVKYLDSSIKGVS